MKPLLILMSLMLLLGCQKPSGQWEALAEVPVFEEADDAERLKFVIRPGEVCALGREQIAKAFMYREVECVQGQGWIASGNGYPFRQLPSPIPGIDGVKKQND